MKGYSPKPRTSKPAGWGVLILCLATAIYADAGGNGENCFNEVGFRAYGNSTATAVHGAYAYHGVGYNILMTDRASGGEPNILAKRTIEFEILDLCVRDDRLFVLHRGGIGVFSIESPLGPAPLTRYNHEWEDWYAGHFEVRPPYAYVGAGEKGLKIIDFTDYARPVEIGACRTPAPATRVRIEGDHAFIANGKWGVRIINISDPARPYETRYIRSPGFRVYDLDVEGSYLYVTTATGEGPWMNQYLNIYDISKIYAPLLTAQYKIVALGTYQVIEESEGFVYLSSATMALIIVDISNKWIPRMVAGLEGSMDWSVSVSRMTVVDGMLYAANGGGIRAIDAGDPNVPREIWRLRTLGLPYDLIIAGEYLYTANFENLSVLSNDGDGFRDVKVHPYDLIYDIEKTNDFLVAWDFYNTIKIFAGKGPDLEPLSAFDVGYRADCFAVDEKRIYAISGKEKLLIYNMDDPHNVFLEGEYGDFDWALDIEIKGHYAYIAENGLTILDVSDPSNPQEVAHLFSGCRGTDVALDSEYIYLLCLNEGLKIIRPENGEWTLTGEVELPLGEHLWVGDGFAYIQTNEGEIAIVDVRDPASPALVYMENLGRTFRGIAGQGRRIFSLDRQCGIEVYDASDCIGHDHGRPTEKP